MGYTEIKKENVTAQGGKTELYVDGEKRVPLLYAMSDIPAGRTWTECSQKNIANFANCGISLVSIDCEIHSGWTDDGVYDPANPLKEIEYAVKANPNAKILIRLHLNAPYWWMRKNPDELIGYFGGEMTDDGEYGDRLIRIDGRPVEMRVSFVSEKYYKECGEVIKKLCKAIKSSKYADNFIAVQVAYGTCGEWHPYGKFHTASDNAEADYGKAMLGYFRKYVCEKYKTEENLQAAYQTDETFENVRLATPTERYTYTDEKYRFASNAARALDSLVCFQTAITTAISAFCKAVKEADKGLLAGAFYGYYFGAGDVFSAMYEQDRLFADENVDFLAATAPYCENKHTGNHYMCRHTPESFRLNGKLFLCEMDQGYAAHSNSRKVKNTGLKGIFECESEEEYAAVLKRNIMENVLHGNGAWYYDHRLYYDSEYEKVGYWDKKERLELVSEIQRVCEKFEQKPFVKTTDVLLVFDGQKCYNMGTSFFYNTYNSFDFLDAVMKSGAGVDVIFLSDIKKVDLARYKCVMFVECITMSSEIYAFVKDTVAANGRTVAFVDKCGYIVDDVPSEKNTQELVSCGVYMPEPICDKKYYHDLFKRAGACIYTDGGELVVADNEMVMVHTKGVPQTVLHLPCGDITIDNGKYNTVVYNVKTGKKVL